MLTRKETHILKYLGAAAVALLALVFTQTDVSLSGNEASRFAVVQAWGEQRVFHINSTEFRTVDRIVRDGKVYSDKPLPLSWALGSVHASVHACTGLNFHDNYHLLIYLYNLLAGGLVNVLIFLWLFDHLRRRREGTQEKKFVIALGAVLGSWLLSYSVTVNNHTPAALAFLGWFIVLDKFGRAPGRRLAAVAGLTAGIVTALDIPTGFFCCLATPLVLYFSGGKNWRLAGTGLAVCAAAGIGIAGLNMYAYDTILPLYVANGGGTFTPGTGRKDHLFYAFEALLGGRGLLSYQPFLLFLLPGLGFFRKKLSCAAWGALACVLACIVFYVVMTNEFGGAAYGFRYFIPVLPVLWYFAGAGFLGTRARWKQGLAGFLLLWGVAASLTGAYAPFCLSFEGYRSPEHHVTRAIRSSFAGNLLTWSYETAPDSALTRTLRRHYGQEVSRRYLMSSFLMLKKVDALGRIARESPQKK